MTTALIHSEIAASFPVVAAEPRYQSAPSWFGNRYFESAETTRLNQAHWFMAQDESVNAWLAEHLSVIRARSAYEARQNGTVLGVINTHADDIVGPDGPTLQVISDNEAYNDALEQTWREWFAAPTHKPNFSGAAWLKLRIRSLWKNGEFLDQIITDPNAEGSVAMRVRPIPPRCLASPSDMTGDPNVFMGIRFDALGRPARYYVSNPSPIGQQGMSLNGFSTIPPDLIIHEFIAEEEDQARGIPWLNTALQPSADLRDYDDQIQDAARQGADNYSLLYTDNPEAPVWDVPEQTTVERRVIKMAPPGWKPHDHTATMPSVQYCDYRAERQREVGRPQGMPLLMIRLDSSKHNYSSARLDTQTYARAVAGIQYWLSGTENSYGTLNRLVDLVAAEARFKISALRRKPEIVRYKWTWPARPHVDPSKEASAEATSLENQTLTLTDALAARGKSLETHIDTLKRERDLLEAAGLPVPAWLKEQPQVDPAKTTATQSLKKSIDDEEAVVEKTNELKEEEATANG
jgi:capsid protein